MERSLSNKNKVTQLQLSSKRASEIIREAVLDTSRIQWTRHVQKRMRERRITTAQLLDALDKGKIIEGPRAGLEVAGSAR